MTWFHIYDLLRAQHRFFPHGDIRPFAPLPSGWPEIEAMFRREEAESRPVVDAAIDEFIHRGSWPENLSDRERVWIWGRINFGAGVALRLAVPVSRDIVLFPRPTNISDDQIFTWLLIWQWDALGFADWLLDLHLQFQDRHRKPKEPFDSIQLPPHVQRDTPPPWHSNN